MLSISECATSGQDWTHLPPEIGPIWPAKCWRKFPDIESIGFLNSYVQWKNHWQVIILALIIMHHVATYSPFTEKGTVAARQPLIPENYISNKFNKLNNSWAFNYGFSEVIFNNLSISCISKPPIALVQITWTPRNLSPIAGGVAGYILYFMGGLLKLLG